MLDFLRMAESLLEANQKSPDVLKHIRLIKEDDVIRPRQLDDSGIRYAVPKLTNQLLRIFQIRSVHLL